MTTADTHYPASLFAARLRNLRTFGSRCEIERELRAHFQSPMAKVLPSGAVEIMIGVRQYRIISEKELRSFFRSYDKKHPEK